jgi:hypothetical protein
MATNNLGNNLESWTVYTGNPITGNTGLTVSTTSATYAYAMLSNVTTSTVTGRPNVDFVWGNFPLQPNDERSSGTPSATVTVGGSQNVQWTNTSTVNSAYLDYTKDTQNIAEANYSGFPSFIAGDPVLRVTAASGNGTTVTYTAQSNGINPASLVGQNVTITGLTASAFNLTNATIASATAYQFTVTNSAGSGVSITGQYGVAQLGAGAADSDGSFVGGVAYVTVPSVLGQTTANATTILTALELVPTTATAATNTPISITAAARTALSSTATVTATGAGAAFPVGTKITIAGLADATTTELNGTWTVTANATNTVSFVSNATTAIAVASPTGTPTVKGTTGTIKSQSIAAGAASIAAAAAITITPFA